MLKKIFTGFALILMGLIMLFAGMLIYQARLSRNMTVTSGVEAGLLLPCPASPNCVSSQTLVADSHYIAPIVDSGGVKWAQLPALLDSFDSTERQSVEGNYLYYTFSTPVMGFVDDVEFFFAEEQGLIHVRSASRVGYGDGGTNRNRIEMIRSGLE